MKKYFEQLYQVNVPFIDISELDLSELNITILGRRGSGKSTFAKKLLSDISKHHKKTIIIFDSMNEYSGKYHFTSVSEFTERISKFGLENEIYVFKSNKQSENEFLFDIVEDLENCLFIVEESSKFSKSQGIYEPFGNIVNYGRHNKLTYIAIARRSTEIHKDIISNSHYIISFKQILDSDIKVLKDFGFSENLRSLRTFEYELTEP